jgi:hypothetical protein
LKLKNRDTALRVGMRKKGNRCDMTKAKMNVAVAQHARNVNGNLHRFSVRWAGVEPRWTTGGRVLLAVDVSPEHPTTGWWTTLHVLTSARTTREQLLSLITAAFDSHLREHGSDLSTEADQLRTLSACVAGGDDSADMDDLVLTSKTGSRT